jgi:hypothetical protein
MVEVTLPPRALVSAFASWLTVGHQLSGLQLKDVAFGGRAIIICLITTRLSLFSVWTILVLLGVSAIHRQPILSCAPVRIIVRSGVGITSAIPLMHILDAAVVAAVRV